MKIDIYHNIRWARYKARIFSALYDISIKEQFDVRFFQIADTSNERIGLSDTNLKFHDYPHTLLFDGAYQNIPKTQLYRKLFLSVWHSDAALILIPGYDRIEHWLMLLACILSNKKRGVFCDSTLNDRYQSSLKGILKRIFFHFCNGYFGYGTRSKELLLHYGADPAYIFEPCQAAAVGVEYSPSQAREDRLLSFPKQSNPRILYVGRLSPEKGLDTLLKAFPKVMSFFPGSKLVLVGSGPQLQFLRELAVALSIADSVEFLGSMDPEEIGNLYLSSTCLVLPSSSEPWGLVVNEALHQGCPVVVSDQCGCVPELVIDGITGYAFRSGVINDLSEKLIMLITTFIEPPVVVERCLDVIKKYHPESAASQIAHGCRAIFSASRR